MLKDCLIVALVVSVIFTVTHLPSKAQNPLTYGPVFSGAMTLNTVFSLSTPQMWAKACDLHFPKYQDQSNMLFTSQITFSQDEMGPYGIMFKLRFRTEEGEYISESPFTGQVSMHSYVYQNAMLSDTILDSRVMEYPPAGNYVAELWVFTGGGTLNIVPQATNITVWEAPFFITPN